MTIKNKKVFDSVLARVPQDGWTAQAFAAGVKASRVPAAVAHKAYPVGIDDIVSDFHNFIDDVMRDAIRKNRRFAAMRVRDKVTFAVRARLEAIAPHKESMRRLLVRSLMPRHIGEATNRLWQVADQIWIVAGDTATDYNRYTKRLLLIGVMKSTLSFWLNDASRDHTETWAFLDRRIADVLAIGKGMSVIKAVGISDIADFVRSRFAA